MDQTELIILLKELNLKKTNITNEINQVMNYVNEELKPFLDQIKQIESQMEECKKILSPMDVQQLINDHILPDDDKRLCFSCKKFRGSRSMGLMHCHNRECDVYMNRHLKKRAFKVTF